jgi:DNA-binding MarR family transcriptional regulator
MLVGLAHPKSNGDATLPADDFQLRNFLPYRLTTAANGMTRLFARRLAEECGLSIPQWRVLAVLSSIGSASPSVVAKKGALDKVSVSRAVNDMAARGLLRQTPNPVDGRAHVLHLTRKGLSAYHRAMPLTSEIEAHMAAALSRAERDTLRKALGRLVQHFEALDGADEAASDG